MELQVNGIEGAIGQDITYAGDEITLAELLSRYVDCHPVQRQAGIPPLAQLQAGSA